jgi:DNA-binding PucR family transcriptional regulator
LSTAADQLHVHRNTLMFRLNQFQTMTGLDPVHSFEDAVLCRLLLELDQEQLQQKETAPKPNVSTPIPEQ